MDQGKRGQRRYRESLFNALLNTPYPPPPPPPPISEPSRTHCWERFEKRGYCIWCKKYTEKWEPKRARHVLGKIINGAASAQARRQSRTYGGCKICSAYFCVKGACFELYHRNSNNR
jgi:hypothetical protein